MLRARNRDLKQVLDNVGQGFLAMDPDGTVSHERSAIVDQWFGEIRVGEPIWSYLGRGDAEFADGMRRGWASLLHGSLGSLASEATLAGMPARLKRGERTFTTVVGEGTTFFVRLPIEPRAA